MSYFSRRALVVALLLAAAPVSATASPCDGRADQASAIVPGAPLKLQSALSEVRRVSPAVRAAGLQALAAHADADQSGRRLNPSFAIEVENFAGTGALTGFGQSETTFSLEQTFRLGGKRKLGQQVARAKSALASAECSVILRQAEVETALLFAELIAANELKILANESATLGKNLVFVVERRVLAGAAAPPELARAKVDAATSEASVASTEATVERLRYALSVMWGQAEPVFSSLQPLSLNADDIAYSEVTGHPEIRAADAAANALDAGKALARTASTPDITISTGVRRFDETGDSAFIVGISMPMPLFDRGQDAVKASALRHDAAKLGRLATENKLLARQRAAVLSQLAAETRLNILMSDALPAAQEAYSAALRGYQAGRFDLTTTLNARAALIDTRVAVINAQLALHTELLRLRALTGASPFEGGQP